jgi:hypothetical protein
MKRSLTILLASLAVLLATFGVYSLVLKGGPKIVVSPGFKDLGDVTKEGFNYTFTVKNAGKKPLKIGRVSTSCGCTLATIESELIMPNERTDLLVTFNPKLMEEEVRGEVSRIIFIRSNDPENPELEIKITANVVEG